MIKEFKDKNPYIDSSSFIAENSTVIGDVKIGANSSVWFGTVVRGDVNSISIGENTNIQDNSTIHVNSYGEGVKVGNNVTVGHNVILHGCTIADNCLIGIGAIVLDEAKIGENTIIAAGSLVPPGKEIPSGVMCMGSPCKVVRSLKKEELEKIRNNSKQYVELSKEYIK